MGIQWCGEINCLTGRDNRNRSMDIVESGMSFGNDLRFGYLVFDLVFFFLLVDRHNLRVRCVYNYLSSTYIILAASPSRVISHE